MNKSRTLFSRLFWSVALSELIIFLVVGAFSYFNVKQILVNTNHDQNDALKKEITGLLDFQDFSLKSIERSLDKRLELASWELVELIFSETDSIEEVNLLNLMEEINLQPKNELINVFNKEMLVVNSSSPYQLDFSPRKGEHDEYIKRIENAFQQKGFHSGSFRMDAKHKTLSKRAYQATNDGNYVIEIIMDSEEGSKISGQVNRAISNIGENRESLVSLDIYVNPENPFSVADDMLNLTKEESDLIVSVFNDKNNRRLTNSENDQTLITEYLYNERADANLFGEVVVKLVRDLQIQEDLLRDNFYRKAGLFIMGLLILFVVLIINANLITNPIVTVSDAAQNLGRGNLSQRVPILGSKEVRGLANSFNQMAVDLEASYKQIREQKEKIEKAHKDIHDSITYAKRIQAAILPPSRLVRKYMKDYFILYKPKAIVAGDFYWVDRIEDRLYFAVADCTGHGVPGAMISVICHSALNRSLREYSLSEPADILSRTRDIVLQEFEKSDDEVQDGMDIALCSLEKRKLKFAGAQRPAYIVRKGEIIELKGDRQPVGMFSNQKPYSNQEFTLQKGDTVYLFTDGLTDQFGGPNFKKMLPFRLQEFLLTIQDKPIDEHRLLIDEFFEEWKGDDDQIDDVCIMGIRID